MELLCKDLKNYWIMLYVLAAVLIYTPSIIRWGELIGGRINNGRIRDACWKVRKMTKMLRWWVSYNYYYFCSNFFLFRNLLTWTVYTLVTIPVCALFTLVSFFFTCTVHAGKFCKKKIIINLPAWTMHTLVSFEKKTLSAWTVHTLVSFVKKKKLPAYCWKTLVSFWIKKKN